MQMGVTGHKQTYFVIWTPHDMIVEKKESNEEYWCSLKDQFLLYYDKFYLPSVFSISH